MTWLRRTIVLCVSLVLFATSAIAADRVRVSVFGLFHPKQITLESKQALLVKAGEREFVLEPGRKAVVNLSQGQVSVAGTVADQVSIAPRDGSDAEFELAVPGRIRRTYRGQVSVLVNGAELEPVISMELETAVASVNAAESTPGATMEALKAQAVAIRSYLVAGKPRHKDSDFCDTTHCQLLKAPPAKDSLPAQATEATRGLVLSWEGKPFAAMYSASCSGRTHPLAEIGYKVRDYPYFAVDCEYCRKNPERWTATVSREDAATLALKSEVERVRLSRKLGWNTVPSNDHQAKANETMVDLAGVGRGHGLGLCQRGAAAMAREGKSFREILAHYFPNAEIKSVVSSF